MRGLSLGWKLSAATVVLMVAQSAIGLFVSGVYHDVEWIRLTWLGNDAVTLFLAAPALAVALALVRRGSLRAQLLWYALLGYAVYNYAYYLYGATLNVLFPLCVGAVVCSAIALMYELGTLDVSAVAARFSARTPVRSIGAYMLFTGVGLGGVWLAMWAGYVFAGAELPIEEPAFRLVASLDWTYVIPFFILGAVLLMRKQPWGYVLASMMNVKGALYTFILAVNSYISYANGVEGSLAQVPIWGAWTVGSVVATWVLMRHITEPAETA